MSKRGEERQSVATQNQIWVFASPGVEFTLYT